MDGAMGNANPHVLLVEDPPMDRRLASRVLKICNIQGVTVTLAESLQEALDFLDDEARGVKLILTDCCMPGMTGYELLIEVKNSPKLNHIPVVSVCSDDNPETIKKCLDGGAKDFILKPFKVADVPHILSNI